MRKDCGNCFYHDAGLADEPCISCQDGAPTMWRGTTNGDRFRAMSDEELAEMIGDFIDCAICKRQAGTEICPATQHDCYGRWLDWLREATNG